MEMEPSLQPAPSLDPASPAPVVPAPSHSSRLPIIFLSILTFLSLSGLVFFYFQNQSLKKQSSEQDKTVIKDEVNDTVVPSQIPAPGVNWTEKTYPLKPGFEGGSIVANLSFKLPADWTVELTNRTDKGILNECHNYIIKSADGKTTVTLSPVCTSWGAQYAPMPENASIISRTNQGSNAGDITKLRVRYSNTQNQLTYMDADNSNQIMDVMMVSFAPPDDSKYDYYFVPFSLTTNPVNDPKTVEIIDQIAASVTLK